MSEPNASLSDQQGVIRYDWPGIQLLFTAGCSPADIARSLTQDCPDNYDTVRKTVAQRSSRYEWTKTADEAKKLVSANPSSIYNKTKELSSSVVGLAQNIALERKKSYLDRTSGFIDRASKLLEDRPLESLEDAAMAGKLFDPVHQIAKDVHGLNAREPVAALQVNILSDQTSFQVTQDE